MVGVKRERDGWMTGVCPSCSNRRFGVKRGDRGWIVNCWEGCTLDDVCGALGIPATAMFFDEPPAFTGVDFDLEKFVLAQAVCAKRRGSPVTGADRERAKLAAARLIKIGRYNEVLKKIG